MILRHIRLIFALLAWSFTLATAQGLPDCTQPANGSKEATYLCAKQHAEYLYRRVCGDKDPCTAADHGIVAAFARASTLLDQGWPIIATPEAAFTHAFLEERAHLLDTAITHYGKCLHIGAATSDVVRMCATRLIHLHCAAGAAGSVCDAPSGTQSETSPPQPKRITIDYSGGGTVLGKKPLETNMAAADLRGTVEIKVVTPTPADVLSTGLTLSQAEKAQIKSRLKVEESVTTSAKTPQ